MLKKTDIFDILLTEYFISIFTESV